MPILRPPTIKGLKEACERAGYRAIDEDEYNWLMVDDESKNAITIPKKGKQAAAGVVDAIVHSRRATARLRKEIHEQIRKEGDELAAAEAEVDD